MRILYTITLLFSLKLTHAAVEKQGMSQTNCLAAREYITTVSYLRENKDFQLKETEVQKVADDVSKGCTGSSKRFIKVVKLLTKMGIDTRSSMQSALKFTQKDDDYTKAFVEIFRKAYDPKFLDLDIHNAMRISLKLSAEYKGSAEKSIKDFNQLVEFCLRNKSMDLPSPKCAELATKITSLGHEYEEQIAPAFIKLMSFLQEESKGPKLDRSSALKIAEEVIEFGPIAPENFEQAFRFALNKEGLGYPIPAAIEFAKTLAKRSKIISN